MISVENDFQGKWVREDLWLPPEIGLDEWYLVDHPAIIIARFEAWGLVRAEVFAENPQYPVQLIRPYSPLYGARVRSIELRYMPEADDEQWQLYWDHLQCRIEPVSDE